MSIIHRDADPALVEALIVLVAELSTILSTDWHDKPSEAINREINLQIARALHTAV